ncbi:TPA: glutamate-1-semialdehyde-2,1-aminomutase [Candidatus Poribacteria bacterium]|nr:glutamate-1-semialdehyde-2,1-aminomutase [Candidatus Poribacteria bacterium]
MQKNYTKSISAFEESQKYIPGGVNSPVRAFRTVGGNPLFIKRGKGSKIYDIDDNEYIDYVCSWGPLILGHAHPKVVAAIQNAAEYGTSYGAPTELETELAEIIVNAVPSIDLVRMVSSGTEAAMSAIRLARGYTQRDKIIKVEGCYHGHADCLLVKAGSGAATFGVPDSAGVPADFAQHTITVPFNDAEAVRIAIQQNPEQVACVILEPIAGNMGVVPPTDGYLAEIREITAQKGVVLIFDEVITGFRVAFGGAQELYDVIPDMTCLGKIIGGGMPVGAYGGKREIMECIAPLGPVYQAGTLSGNPLAMSAGIATLKILSEPVVYEKLENRSSALAEGLLEATKAAGVDAYHTRVGSMLSIFFTSEQVVDYTTAKTSDTDRFAAYFRGLLERGIYIAPSQFESGFVSLAHSDDDIQTTIRAASEVLQSL